MSRTIAILDDEPERIREMTRCLLGCEPQYDIAAFDDVVAEIQHVLDGLAACSRGDPDLVAVA